MITSDQVSILGQKVDLVVKRLAELTAENSRLKSDNDALRSKCAELTKALSRSSEQVSTLESEQNEIEQGILVALNRLDTVENTILAGSTPSSSREEDDTYKTDIIPQHHFEEVQEEAPAPVTERAQNPIMTSESFKEIQRQQQYEAEQEDSGMSGNFEIF